MIGFLDRVAGFLPAPPAAGTGTVTSVTAGDSTITVAGTGPDPTVAVALAATFAWTGTHSWETADNGTATVTTSTSIQHRNNAAGTPAAGYGVGKLFKLDSSARTLRTAGELDCVWSTATDGAEVSSLAFKTMLAGTLTEVVRFGTGAALPDSDFSVSIGRCLIDSRTTDQATFSHRDQTATTAYALRQTAAGAVTVNAPSGQNLSISNQNNTKIQINSTGVGFFGAAAVGQQALSGSRGGNAALATVCTALANLGLATDGTTA